MSLRKPSIFFRAMILGAQGVFYNMFCTCPFVLSRLPYLVLTTASMAVLAYLVSPKTCHRFVGHLEEEAVLT